MQIPFCIILNSHIYSCLNRQPFQGPSICLSLPELWVWTPDLFFLLAHFFPLCPSNTRNHHLSLIHTLVSSPFMWIFQPQIPQVMLNLFSAPSCVFPYQFLLPLTCKSVFCSQLSLLWTGLLVFFSVCCSDLRPSPSNSSLNCCKINCCQLLMIFQWFRIIENFGSHDKVQGPMRIPETFSRSLNSFLFQLYDA